MINYMMTSDFPFQKKQFSISKKSEIPFQFRFIIAKIELDEITNLCGALGKPCTSPK